MSELSFDLEKEYRVEQAELDMLKNLGIIGASEYSEAKSALRKNQRFASLFAAKKQAVQIQGKEGKEGQVSLESYNSGRTGEEQSFGTGKALKEMIFVSRGQFEMGAAEENTEAMARVRPSFQVQLVRDFWMAKTPITQACWIEVMGANPSTFKGDQKPVEAMTWKQCLEFCNKMSDREGLQKVYTFSGNDKITCNWDADGYRLPTSAEWEYAARAGHSDHEQKYAGSNDVQDVAWTKSMVTETQNVAGKSPNNWGFYDMSGNVWEWVWDGYDANAYSAFQEGQLVKDPRGISYSTDRNIRGGSYNDGDTHSMCCSNLGVPATAKYRNVGLRVVRTVS